MSEAQDSMEGSQKASAPPSSSHYNEEPVYSYIAGGCNVSLNRWVYLAAACAQMLLVAGVFVMEWC